MSGSKRIGHPRFSVGDDLAGQFVDADVAVVGELRREPGGHALEQGPAWVGGELASTDPSRCRRLKIRLAAEIAVGVCDAAGREGELVQHGQPVEPVVIALVTHLELRWSGPHQGASEPGRNRASYLQVVQARFPVESTEPQVIRRPVHGECTDLPCQLREGQRPNRFGSARVPSSHTPVSVNRANAECLPPAGK